MSRENITWEEEKETEKFYEDNKNNIVMEDGSVYGENEDCLSPMWNSYDDALAMGRKGYHIATVVTDDNDEFIILNGYHMVNRVGYMVFKEAPINLSDYGVYY